MGVDDFAARADAILGRSLDRVPERGGAAARALLTLFALKHLGDGRPPPEPSWSDVRKQVLRSLEGPDQARGRLLVLAKSIEGRIAGLDGALTTNIDLAGDRVDPLLRSWLADVDGAWPIGTPPGDRIFGNWFGAAVDRWAAAASSGARDLSTPSELADLMVSLADAHGRTGAYDPCCGVGGVLAAFARSMPASSIPLDLVGQDVDRGAASLARLRLFLLTGQPPRITAGDTLRTPAVDGRGDLESHDLAFCHPPFGQRIVDSEIITHDPHGRFGHGAVGRAGTEFASVQHCLATLRPEGRLVALLPLGPLFRGGADEVIRASLVAAGLIDAVVELPSGVLPGTAVDVAVVILARGGGRRTGRIRLIDASGRRDAARDPDKWAQLVIEIVGAVGDAEEVPGFAVTVDVPVVLARASSLQPHEYVPAGRSHDVAADPLTTSELAAILEREARMLAIEIDRVLATVAADMPASTGVGEDSSSALQDPRGRAPPPRG